MKLRSKDIIYVVAAVLMGVVAVQRFRAYANRSPQRWDLARGEADAEFPRWMPKRPEKVRQEQGKTLLWAKGNPADGDAEWFDVTDTPMDPRDFQFGIGKDTIPAIDEPHFLDANDPKLAEFRIYESTEVIGYANGDDARAYPIPILNRHELVNDVVGGKPVTVGW